MGWTRPFRFQVDPLNFRLVWHFSAGDAGGESCYVSVERVLGRAGASWKICVFCMLCSPRSLVSGLGWNRQH